MRPTTQKNNARQRKTIAIVAVIAVVAIALAAVASAFNGVKVVQRYNFDPVKYTFAPYLAYIQQIRETWIHSWSLGQNVHPALAAISRRSRLLAARYFSIATYRAQLPGCAASTMTHRHKRSRLTRFTDLGRGSGLRWRIWWAPTRHGWQHTKRWSLANRLRNQCVQASIRVRYATY